MTDRDDLQTRAAHAKAELESFPIEARRLLEVTTTYLDSLVRAAHDIDEEAPGATALAARIRSLLDRRQLLEVEAYELNAEMREAGLIP